MPPEAPRTCEYPNCKSGPPDGDGVKGPYVTHPDNQRREEVMEDYKLHVEVAHKLPVEEQKTATAALQAQTAAAEQDNEDDVESSSTATTRSRPFFQKRDSIPRPAVEENSTESDWAFFTAQWKRYTEGSEMTPQQEIQQLWAACPLTLQRQLHNGNASNLQSTSQLLNHIKVLAVKRRNNLVSIVEFQRMSQSSTETTTQFSTRLNGQASVCDMFVSCPECQNDISYKDHMILYQFIRGLEDKGCQERILENAAHAEGGKLSLIKTLKIAEAFEMSKASQEQVNNGGQLSKLSQHQVNKQSSRQSARKPQQSTTSTTKTCGNCGKQGHTSKLQDRRDNCKAFDKTCSKCNTNGHYTSMCRGGPRQTRDKSVPKTKDKDKTKVSEVKEKEDEPNTNAELVTMSGDWMLLNGLQSTPDESAFYEDSVEFSSVLQHKKPNSGHLGAISNNVRKIRHHVMDEFGSWKPSNVQPHGKIKIRLKISKSATEQLQLKPVKSTSTSALALADTGAQMCVADFNVAKRMGLSKSDLMIPALSVSVADNSSLELIGAHFMTLFTDSGETSEQLVYFANDVGEFYLSKAALIDLKVISHAFPRVSLHNKGDINEVQDGFPPFFVRTIVILDIMPPLFSGITPRTYSMPCTLKVLQLMPLFTWTLVNIKWRPLQTASLFNLPPASHRVRPHWGQGHLDQLSWYRVFPKTL